MGLVQLWSFTDIEDVLSFKGQQFTRWLYDIIIILFFF